MTDNDMTCNFLCVVIAANYSKSRTKA